MTNRLELSWNLDGFVDEQRYYCSDTPVDPIALPTPKAVLTGDTRAYIDADIDVGKTYYIRVGAVKSGNEKLSSEISVGTSSQLFDPIYISSLFSIVDHDSDVLISNGRVVEWKDRKAGYKFTNNVSDSPSAGTLNDKRILNFSSNKLIGGSDFLSLRNNASSLWGFAVYNCETSGAVDKPVLYVSVADSTSGGFCLEAGSPAFEDKPFIYGRRVGSDGWRGVGDSSPRLNTWVMVYYELDFANDSGKIIVNGGVPVTSANLWGNKQNTESSNALGASIGRSANDFTEFNGGIAAICTGKNGVLSINEIDKLFGWAAHSYALTDNLPASHPYKTIRPTM